MVGMYRVSAMMEIWTLSRHLCLPRLPLQALLWPRADVLPRYLPDALRPGPQRSTTDW